MRRFLVVLVLVGCGGAVATEAAKAPDGDGADPTDPPRAAPPDAGPRPPREVTVSPAPYARTMHLSFSSPPPSCAPVYDGGTGCAAGTCVVYQIPGDDRGWLCVDGDPCAPLDCDVGRCFKGDDSLDNNYVCTPAATLCVQDGDCDSTHPYCVERHMRSGDHDYADRYCARDYASACTYAGCGPDKACIVTESDPVGIRCAP